MLINGKEYKIEPGAKLSNADLYNANLSGAKLSDAKLSCAKLSYADLSGADLSYADLFYSDLSYAKLFNADLAFAKLSCADLSYADLSGANLSGVTGLINPASWMAQKFRKDGDGYLVYKNEIGPFANKAPKSWKFAPGKILEEVVNPDRCTDCGCGINFATKTWCKENGGSPIWLCRIRWEWACSIVVPYNTDGKARCEKLELLKIVKN